MIDVLAFVVAMKFSEEPAFDGILVSCSSVPVQSQNRRSRPQTYCFSSGTKVSAPRAPVRQPAVEGRQLSRCCQFSEEAEQVRMHAHSCCFPLMGCSHQSHDYRYHRRTDLRCRNVVAADFQRGFPRADPHANESSKISIWPLDGTRKILSKFFLDEEWT